MRRSLFAPLLAALLIVPTFGFAQEETDTATNSGIYSGEFQRGATAVYQQDGGSLPEANIATLVGMFIQAILGILGVVFFVLLVYAGLLWMTAAGNGDQVKKAKEILYNATVGLAITLSAYAVARYVIQYLSLNNIT